MIKIGIHGSAGKMGREIASLLPTYKDCALVYSYSRGNGSLEELCTSSDVVLDFSSPEAVSALLDAASKSNTKLLIGTTGLTQEVNAKIVKLSTKLPILQTPNTSFGIALLNLLAAHASLVLQDYEVDILDIHHASKKDAPSGTALMLGNTIAKTQGNEFVAHNHLAGLRPAGAIGFSAIRAGHAPGEHKITFTGSGEIITLVHKTDTRLVFAEGAIKAALWLARRRAGLYKMADVLSAKPL